MNKNAFIDELCRRLRLMPPDEAQRTVLFYAEAIDDRVEDGMTEEEAVASLGSIDDIVREVTGSSGAGQWTGGAGASSAEPPSDRWEQRHYQLAAQGVEELNILETSCDTLVEPSPDGLIHVYCTEGKGVRYEITGGGKVTVRKVIEREFNLFGFSFKLPIGAPEGRLTVQVPEDAAAGLALWVTTSSGDIDLRLPALCRLAAKSAGGSVTAGPLACRGEVQLNTVSGDINIRCVTGASLSALAVSGDVELSDTSAAKLSLATTSGDMEAERVGCGEAKCSSVSGDLSFRGSAAERFAASSVSGDIGFDLLCPTVSIALESVSGDIKGAVNGDARDYTFKLKTTSGARRVPEGNPNGPNSVRIKTVSGDMELRFRR